MYSELDPSGLRTLCYDSLVTIMELVGGPKNPNLFMLRCAALKNGDLCGQKKSSPVLYA